MPIDLTAALAILKSAKRAVVTTHIRPDGDALGSSAAIVQALQRGGAQATPLLLSPIPNKYRFVYDDAGLKHLEWSPAMADGKFLEGVDTLVIVDTGTNSQLPGLDQLIPRFTGKIVVIDHHKTQEPWGNARVVDTSAASATELIADVLDAWGVAIDKSIAQSLYTGLVTDTGWFAFSSTTPRTMRLAARLLEAGVDHDALYKRIYQSETQKRLLLQGRIMGKVRFEQGGKVALQSASRADFAEFKADTPDTEGVINWPLQVQTVEVSLLLTDPPEPGPIRVSLRSKGSVDVAKLAERFGGGGHARAAGCKLPGPLESAIETILQAVATVV